MVGTISFRATGVFTHRIETQPLSSSRESIGNTNFPAGTEDAKRSMLNVVTLIPFARISHFLVKIPGNSMSISRLNPPFQGGSNGTGIQHSIIIGGNAIGVTNGIETAKSNAGMVAVERFQPSQRPLSPSSFPN